MNEGHWTFKPASEELPYQDRMEFSPEIDAIGRRALQSKLWRAESEGISKLQVFADELSTLLGIPNVRVAMGGMALLMGPHYIEGESGTIGTLMLNKVSLTSFLHEYAHHILKSASQTQNEAFPRCFSLGFFKRLAPKMFDRARLNGRLLFVDVPYGQPASPETGLSQQSATDIINSLPTTHVDPPAAPTPPIVPPATDAGTDTTPPPVA